MLLIGCKRGIKWLAFASLLLYVLVSAAEAAQRSNDGQMFKVSPGRLARWDNGFLVSWKFDNSVSDTEANVLVYNRDEKLFGKTRIWVEGATFLRITDATVGKDGQVAAVGFATTASGTFSEYLADISVTRGLARIVQLSPFAGRAVGFAPDGTIWVFGADLGPTGDGREPAPDHYTVRQFGTNDVLKGQFLLRSDFHCELGRVPPVRVVPSADRIGFFSSVCRTWVELSLTGEMLGRWTWNPVSQVKYGHEQQEIMSVALTSSNELYGSRRNTGEPLVRFDRKTSEWIPVKMGADPNPAPFLAILLGADDDKLVYATTDAGALKTESGGFKVVSFQPTKAE